MPDLKEQKYIVEIAKAQGIARAAEKLFISQPALSKFLIRTEEAYRVQLFDRVGKKLIPTYAGEQYLKYANQILLLDRDFQKQIADIKELKKGSLSIGSTIARGKVIFSRILPAFKERFPEFELHVYQENASSLLDMLRDGQVQLVLMAVGSEEQFEEFHMEEISTEELCLIAPGKWQLKGVPKFGFRHPWIDIRQLQSHPFLLLNTGSQLRAVEDKLLKSFGLKPQTMEFDSVDTIWNLVSEGFGISMASEFCPPGGLDVELFSMGARPVTWKFVAMTRMGGTISAPIQSMIDIARQEFGNEKS